MPGFAQAKSDSGAILNALARARIAEDAGEPHAALAALSAVASQAPDLPGIRARILEQAIEAGDLPAAQNAANRLWQAGERRFDAQLVLMTDAMRRSDWKAARAYIGGSADKTGRDPVSRLILPALHSWIDLGLREKLPEAQLLGATGRASPEPAFMLEAALVQLAARRPSDAVALADGVTLSDRTSQLVALRLVASLRQRGESDAAARLEKRIALATGAREDPLLLLPEQPVATPRAGVAHWLGLLADGFARTPNSNPKVPLLLARVAHWLNDSDWQVRAALMESLANNDQTDGAIAVIAGEAAAPPVLAMRHAELVADKGELPAAVNLAEKALARDPDTRSLLLRFADIARRSGDPVAAERAYARLESSLGDSESDRALQGVILIARADLFIQSDAWDRAEPLLERAVALRPDDAAVLNFAGYSALERRQDIERSLARIEAAWSKEPQSPSITDSLGWAYFLTGKSEQAVALLEKAQRGAPDNAVIIEHLGDAYWKTGQKFEARYVWRAAALLAEADMATRLEAKLRDGLTPATTAP